MEFIKPGVNVNFVGKRNIAFFISGSLVLISIIALIVLGPAYGVDFAGGSLIQIKFSGPAQIAAIKDGLQKLGIEKAFVQSIGAVKDHEFLIRTDATHTESRQLAPELQHVLEASTQAKVEIRRVETVGPQVGKDLREKALLAIFFSLIFIAIYISGRFEFKWLRSGIVAAVLGGAVYLLYSLGVGMPLVIAGGLVVTLALFWLLGLKYALGAIVALIHDVTITVGVFVILQHEFTVSVIAALLTIIGYSLNDTIIVYDRIRENIRKLVKTPLATVINRSVNETLSRTILTAGTVFIVILALFFLGGDIIHDFAFAMLIGVLVGTYSSIYVASPIVLAWEQRTKKK